MRVAQLSFHTLGYGLIAYMFGIYLLVDRNELARYFARSQWRWQRWLGINLGGQHEETQKPAIVMMAVVCVLLGTYMIVTGSFWWVTS